MTALATRPRRWLHAGPLPGFGLTLGWTLLWLGLIVLVPLVALVVRAAGMGPAAWWHLASDPRVVAAMKLSFGTALAAALIDLPFALPTAVAGIALTAIYAGNGWLGQWLEAAGFKIAYAPAGIVVALVFVGLPFAVRTVQPVLESLHKEHEEAAASLGASRFTTLRRVVFPQILPAVITGFSLAFARGVGEYGSVIFIAGNLPYVSEIAPLLIVIKLEEFDYGGATVIASLMLGTSFLILFLVNWLQRKVARGQSV